MAERNPIQFEPAQLDPDEIEPPLAAAVGEPYALISNVSEFGRSLVGIKESLESPVRISEFVVRPTYVALGVEFKYRGIRSLGDLVCSFRPVNGFIVTSLRERLRP